MNYTLGRYLDPDTKRKRWAVFCKTTRTWYFASGYGKRAATERCSALNKIST